MYIDKLIRMGGSQNAVSRRIAAVVSTLSCTIARDIGPLCEKCGFFGARAFAPLTGRDESSGDLKTVICCNRLVACFAYLHKLVV